MYRVGSGVQRGARALKLRPHAPRPPEKRRAVFGAARAHLHDVHLGMSSRELLRQGEGPRTGVECLSLGALRRRSGERSKRSTAAAAEPRSLKRGERSVVTTGWPLQLRVRG